MVQHGERAGKREAHRAGVRVRRRAEVGGAVAEGLRSRLELHVHLEPDDHLVAVGDAGGRGGGHRCASTPSARSSAYAVRNMRSSLKCGAMICPPTGSPSMRPIGCDMAGTPARLAVTVKMS